MKRFLVNFTFLLILSFPLFGNAGSLESEIKGKVKHYFYRIYHVAPEKMAISYLRFPDVSGLSEASCKIHISSQKLNPRLGYQTLWVELSQNSTRIKRFPVSLDISLETNVIVANTRIKRHQVLKPELFRQQSRLIKEDWNTLCRSFDELEGMESTRVLQEGVALTRKLIRPVPVIRRGDLVEVHIEAGQLLLSSNAIAKSDAGIGDKLQVESQPGGKRLNTTVKGPGLVYCVQESKL